MNFFGLGHFKVSHASHPSPRVAWLESSLLDFYPLLARRSSYSKVPSIVQRIQGSPRPKGAGLAVVQLVSPAYRNELAILETAGAASTVPTL